MGPERPNGHRTHGSRPLGKATDPLVRYIVFHWALGLLGGALFATLLLLFDPFGMWPLIRDSGLGLQAIFLLYVGFMTSFGSLVCAAAVMFPPKDRDDDEPPRGGLKGTVRPKDSTPRLSPVRVSAPRTR